MKFTAILALLISSIATAQTIPWSESEPYRVTLGSPVVGGDGESFYMTVGRHDAETDESIDTVVRMDFHGSELDGGLPRVPTHPSPDGQWLAYTDDKDDQDGLWIYNIEDDEERFLVPIPASNHFLGHRANKNFVWSPDSQSIAYCAAEPSASDSDSDVNVIDRILFKTRTAFTDNLHTQIFLIGIDGGDPQQLTTGPHDNHSLGWRPGGKRIAFTSNRTADPDDNHNNDLWTVHAETGAITQMTDTPGTEFGSQWSPNGKRLAYLAGTRMTNTKDSQPENPKLFVLAAPGPIQLAADLDRRIRTFAWAPDNASVFLRADDHGGVHLYRAYLDGRPTIALTQGSFRVMSMALSESREDIVYKRIDFSGSGEIWTASFDGKSHRKLTRYQREFNKEVVISKPQEFWFESFDGTPVQGWLMKPASFHAQRKYPLIMTIHGGPHGAYGYGLSASNQRYAEAGYGVIFINPRGSTGYGQRFTEGTLRDWGGGDYQDLMLGLDHAIAHNAWIDTERLGVIGGSYGGYMTNWVITQTDRFAAAVSVASLSNLVSFYGTSLYQLLIETEYPGEVWENFDALWRDSPLAHIANATTPTLILHGENDHDVPITQAEEMYVALKKRGVETVFVRYPNEGHGFKEPAHREDMRSRVNEWFEKFLTPNEAIQR